MSIFEGFKNMITAMKISDLLNTENILPLMEPETKEQAFEAMVDAMQKSVGFDISEKALKAVLERESIMSTGVGKGLAIPHGRVAGLTGNFAAFASLNKSIDYGSIDGKEVNMIFMLVGPETQNSLHIKLLSRISRLMNNDEFRSSILQCESAAEIHTLFVSEENKNS